MTLTLLPIPIPLELPVVGFYYNWQRFVADEARRQEIWRHAYEVLLVTCDSESDYTDPESYSVVYRTLDNTAPTYLMQRWIWNEQRKEKHRLPCVDEKGLRWWNKTQTHNGVSYPRFTRITDEHRSLRLKERANTIHNWRIVFT